jgi:biopolymer transport protein ExbD
MAMTVKVSMGDDTVMNMTPMIDICFNLVIFFMLTLDLSSKEYEPLTLAFASHGVPDKDDPADPIASRKAIVNVLADGKIVLKGNPWNLSSTDPKEQYAALRALQNDLALVTADDGLSGVKLREPDQHSKIPLQIHGDRAANWRYVQWIIATASHHRIMMYKVYFSVKQPVVDKGTGS